MNTDLLTALATFAFVTVITPGPNNLMLMASGANFGIRRSIPHMLGIVFGFPAMIFLVGLGVMQLFELWPPLHLVLKIASVIYMLWLAWKIANARPPDTTQAPGNPLSFLQSAAFQWVNPKAWTMALGAITLYAASRDIPAVALVSITYVMVGCISTTTWVVLGQQMRRLLRNPTHLRMFNVAMALLLVASLIPVLI